MEKRRVATVRRDGLYFEVTLVTYIDGKRMSSWNDMVHESDLWYIQKISDEFNLLNR